MCRNRRRWQFWLAACLALLPGTAGIEGTEAKLEAHMARRKGFTLVELLIVIGIIALLIGILLPALNSARAQSQLIQCESNIRQIVTAEMLFAQDHRGCIPTCSDNQWTIFADTVPTSKFSYRNSTPTLGRNFVVLDWASALI